MLKARPNGWFSWNFVVSDGGDRQVADIHLALLREAGQLVVQNAEYSVSREGIMSGAFVLRKDGVNLARAEKPSAFHRSFEITEGGRKYLLEAESAFRRKFVLKEGERVSGSVYPVSAFTRKCVVDLPDSIPLAVRVFMVWLVIILWKRDDNAAAAVAAS